MRSTLPSGAGADGLLEAGGAQALEQLAHAREERNPVAGSGLVVVLLAHSQLRAFLLAEALAEKVLENFGIPTAEGGGEVGPTEAALELAAQPFPGAEVHFAGVDEGAVDVPDGGTAIRGSGRIAHVIGAPECFAAIVRSMQPPPAFSPRIQPPPGAG